MQGHCPAGLLSNRFNNVLTPSSCDRQNLIQDASPTGVGGPTAHIQTASRDSHSSQQSIHLFRRSAVPIKPPDVSTAFVVQERSSKPLAWSGIAASALPFALSIPCWLTPCSSRLWHSYSKQARRLCSSSARVLSPKASSFKPENLVAMPTLSTKAWTLLLALNASCVRRQK